MPTLPISSTSFPHINNLLSLPVHELIPNAAADRFQQAPNQTAFQSTIDKMTVF